MIAERGSFDEVPNKWLEVTFRWHNYKSGNLVQTPHKFCAIPTIAADGEDIVQLTSSTMS